MRRGMVAVNLDTPLKQRLALRKRKMKEKSVSEREFIIATRKKQNEEIQAVWDKVRKDGKKAFKFLIEEEKHNTIYSSKVKQLIRDFKNPFIRNKLKLYRCAIKYEAEIKYAQAKIDVAINKILNITEK